VSLVGPHLSRWFNADSDRGGENTVPYSGGSSVEGHFSAPFGGISVDFVNMNSILEVQPDE
jgi:hypothetical protein